VDTAPLSDPKAPTEMAMGSGGSGGGGLATLVVEATLVEVDKKATKEAAAEKAVADKASVEEKVVTEASAALAKEATVVTTTKEAAGATLDPKVGAKWVAPSSGGRSPHPKWFRGSWAFKPPPSMLCNGTVCFFPFCVDSIDWCFFFSAHRLSVGRLLLRGPELGELLRIAEPRTLLRIMAPRTHQLKRQMVTRSQPPRLCPRRTRPLLRELQLLQWPAW
jgi:hypothetical protein